MKNRNIDLSSRSSVIQDVIWSVSVQIGPGSALISNALAGKNISELSDTQIVELIYEERGALREDGLLKYFPKASKDTEQKQGLINRFKAEKKAALKQLSRN